MAEVAQDTKKRVITKLADFAKLNESRNVRVAGEGTPFWVLDPSIEVRTKATIKLSQPKPDGSRTVYLTVYDGVKNFIVNPGSTHFEPLQTLVDYENEEMDVVLCYRKPNPAVTDSDIKGVEERYGKERTEKFLKARENDQQELFLMSYVDPEL